MSKSCGCATFTCSGTYVPGCRRTVVINEEECKAIQAAAIQQEKQENVVDTISNKATPGTPWRKKQPEDITVEKARGHRGSDGPLRLPDYGTAVPAYVVDGKIVRVDGKPHRR